MPETRSDPYGNLAAARLGDSGAFELLAEPYRKELLAYCYRILGSLQDAEDMVQETLIRAWRRLETFQGRASFRAWLYKIATNICLDALVKRPKRSLPVEAYPPADPYSPPPAPILEPVWVEPYPDDFLPEIKAGPEARYDQHESISLAFLVALQTLPPRQRCILILNDVLDMPLQDIADSLDITVSSANSLLYRARMSLKKSYSQTSWENINFQISDPQTKLLLNEYMRAWEEADVDKIVSLLKEDASFPMPPIPAWYRGRSAIRIFISNIVLAGEARGRWRLLPLRANACHGFAFYVLDSDRSKYLPFSLQVLRFEGNLLADVTTFGYPHLFRAFNFPDHLDLEI